MEKEIKAKAAVPWFVYLIRTASGSLYCGISTDVERRLKQHSSGKGGARALRGRGPLQLVFQQPVGDRSTASKVEYRIKRLTKARKEALVTAELTLAELIASDNVSESRDD